MKTLQSSSQAEITVKGSRFLSFAYPVRDAQSALDWVSVHKQEHPKARHWCYAYRLGIDGADYRANDDGEPSGTAGLPILQQIQSFELSNTAVVVVRYFGGTLLGVSGLIKAYKQSAREALLLASLETMVEQKRFVVRCAYAEISALLGLLKRYEAEVTHQSIDLEASFEISLPKESALGLQSALRERFYEVIALD
ncbi:MAG: YigZ family protein [Cardiobacteriaceae bacterium]|nr:YigZ family protein [Cardiobacteriaceae bacterium]